MKKQTEIQGLLTQVKDAADKLLARINTLDDEIQALYQQRSALLSHPLSKADYIATIRLDIQNKGKRFRQQLTRLLQTGSKVTYPAAQSLHDNGLQIRYLDAGMNTPVPITEEACYFYFEDAIVDGVERAMAGNPWPVDAMPLAERQKALEVIDGQITERSAERDELAEQLTACGLTG